MTADAPVLDTLTDINATSIERSHLMPRELMLARIAALVAVDAPPASYLANAGAAADSGVSEQDVQEIMIAVAPVVGTAESSVSRREHHAGPRLRDQGRGGRTKPLSQRSTWASAARPPLVTRPGRAAFRTCRLEPAAAQPAEP